MTETDTTTTWEDKLDLELIKLAELEASATNAVVGATAPTRSAPVSLDAIDGKTVTIREFRVRFSDYIRDRIPLPVSVYDGRDRLLAAGGSRITRNFVVLLRQRRITHVKLRRPTPGESSAGALIDESETLDAELHTKQSKILDERAAGEMMRPIVAHPVRPWRRPRLPIDDLKQEAAVGVQRHEATSATVEELCTKLKPGRKTSASELQSSVNHFVDAAAADFDLLPLIVAMQQSDDEYLFDHCVNVALLSVAMASQLGFEREIIIEIGLGAMLQDIGMLRVPHAIRLAPRPLTEREWHEIHRHPLHTLDMIAELRSVPQVVKFIGYQVHERMDGSGYPRRRQGHQLHECAKIVALADAYAAMTRKRPHREPLTPYQAAKTILLEGASNKFEKRLIRVLLDTISLFPIGSRVCLSGGINARVLRTNPGMHTRPVVEELSVDGSPTGHIIDLSQEEELAVVATD
ncbi:MAG: HD domain-containing phosphohydrolase [Phycisphaerae bacterium]|jgi:HD-GYP domain-containing protein (c-di-GMP phosphodiesterase class II)